MSKRKFLEKENARTASVCFLCSKHPSLSNKKYRKVWFVLIIFVDLVGV